MKLQRALHGLILLVLAFQIACVPQKAATPTPNPAQVIDSYVTPAAMTWTDKLFGCTGQTILVRLTDPNMAKLEIRFGSPSSLTTPAFQIASEDLTVVTGVASSLQNLTLEQVRDLFAGRGDPSVQVWVYASDSDIQTVFDQSVMQGGSVTSLAHMAANPQDVLDALASDPNAIGILPRSWHNGSVREVYVINSVPVLAVTKTDPTGEMKNLIACLQKK